MNVSSNIKARTIKDKILFYTVCVFALLTAIPLFAIIFKVIIKGIRQINFSFFTQSAPNTLEAMMANSAGEIIPGGIANGIIGTLLMVGMATLISIPIGVTCGIYLSENRGKKFSQAISFLADLLQGVPSIVIGLIVYLWIVIPAKSYSAIAGSVALALMMLPLIIRSTEESLNILPKTLKESSLALGTSYYNTVIRILLPSAFSGIFTGILLALSRVIGETAPLMLTALGSSAIQWDVTSPSSSVSLLIWEFYNDPNLQNMIWSAALFLLLLVFVLNIIAKKISEKWKIK